MPIQKRRARFFPVHNSRSVNPPLQKPCKNCRHSQTQDGGVVANVCESYRGRVAVAETQKVEFRTHRASERQCKGDVKWRIWPPLVTAGLPIEILAQLDEFYRMRSVAMLANAALQRSKKSLIPLIPSVSEGIPSNAEPQTPPATSWRSVVSKSNVTLYRMVIYVFHPYKRDGPVLFPVHNSRSVNPPLQKPCKNCRHSQTQVGIPWQRSASIIVRLCWVWVSFAHSVCARVCTVGVHSCVCAVCVHCGCTLCACTLCGCSVCMCVCAPCVCTVRVCVCALCAPW